jgi:hypothetical protein
MSQDQIAYLFAGVLCVAAGAGIGQTAQGIFLLFEKTEEAKKIGKRLIFSGTYCFAALIIGYLCRPK